QEKAKFPGLPYIMLHSLSHLLIAAVSLECGYAASSIRERIYAGESGYGILLYTGSPGSEGTLGGLVQVGNRIEYHLDVALEMGRLCSNDPVCAQHQPDAEQEDRFLHGAACHGCLLIAETSCERRNEFLDRALVVATVERSGAEFFQDKGADLHHSSSISKQQW
ncbi:MAG: Zn-binding domain-containing protein, partial [Nostoc sp.]